MQLSNALKNSSLNNLIQESFGNRVETLRAVVMLLLREVESLEKSVAVIEQVDDDADLPLSEKLEHFEIDMIRCALIKANGRQKAAAKMLGMKFTTLNAKIKKYEIDWRVPGSEISFDASASEM